LMGRGADALALINTGEVTVELLSGLVTVTVTCAFAGAQASAMLLIRTMREDLIVI
jgi:hypothetical protein